MKRNREWLKGWPLAAGIAILVIASLPLVGAAVFMLRVVLFAAFALALLTAVVLLIVSPKFRAWLDLQSDGLMSFSGLQLARDVSVSPSHSWARFRDRRVDMGRIGMKRRDGRGDQQADRPGNGESCSHSMSSRLFPNAAAWATCYTLI